jgi:hypothetical protein
MKFYILCALFLVGCSTHVTENKSSLQELQASALKEYLLDNAVLSDPIIIENTVSSDLNDYKGVVRFKIEGVKRTQTVKCFGIMQDSDMKIIPLISKQKLNIFCES